jgi:hypothetical protein
MELFQAKELALSLLGAHGLADWHFRFSHSLTRFGLCSYTKKTIFLSKHLARLNDLPRVQNTVLHEIAHALVGSRAGHGPAWRRKALEIGCDGKRTFDETVSLPPRAFVGVCPGCRREIQRHRRRDLICVACRSAGRPARIAWAAPSAPI